MGLPTPDLSSTSVALQLLNTAGLGIVGAALHGAFKTLIMRGELLEKSVVQLESAHQSVVRTMEKRSTEIDSRFEDEKKFRALYLSILDDAEVHKEKIKLWKEAELQTVQSRLDGVTKRLEQLEEEYEALREKHDVLQNQLNKQEDKNRFLEKQNRELQVEIAKSLSLRGLA
jgi:hypothetical protein